MITRKNFSHFETFPMVSVIIPVKNEAKRIVACLESLIAVNYPKDRYEIILVDNGSTDETGQVGKSYGAKVFVHPELTISGLRNAGASVAHGNLLAFIDADVVVYKEWLAAAMMCLNRNGGAECVGSFPLPPEEFGWVAKTWSSLQSPGGSEQEFEVSWLPSMNMIVRKEAFERAGGFNSNLVTCEDVDFCYRLGGQHKIIYCKAMGAVHYGEAQSLRQLFKKERWRGSSNYDGLRVHGFRIDELPSFLLPIYYLILALWFVFAIGSFNWKPLGINLICWFLPPLLKSYLSARKVSNYNSLHKMAICYFVYSLARTVAAIDWIRGRLNHLIRKKR